MAKAGGDGVNAAGGTGGGNDSGYIAQLSSQLIANTTYQIPVEIQGNPKATFLVKVGPDCEIESVTLHRSSGVPGWDAAARRGIERTSPLPRQRDGSCPTELEIVRGPRDQQ
ncbi:MAG: TonB C-terminal domain-containing protein [Limnobacter sp.]|nr:TonB C-terminal domain-containing protein [Limnobacter sp.]